jgi:hypothetical protein
VKHPVNHPKIITPELKRELTSRGPQVVARVTCPACGKSGHGNVRYYAQYKEKPWIKYYRCLHCRMRDTGKAFTFAVEMKPYKQNPKDIWPNRKS